jgi:hypothetical protein
MDYTSQSFACEHVIPVAKGGETCLDNLALACGGCNGHKATKLEATDPDSEETVVLFHPRQEKWETHFTWSEDALQIVGITTIGRATVRALHLNRAGVVNIRKLLQMAGLHPPH